MDRNYYKDDSKEILIQECIHKERIVVKQLADIKRLTAKCERENAGDMVDRFEDEVVIQVGNNESKIEKYLERQGREAIIKMCMDKDQTISDQLDEINECLEECSDGEWPSLNLAVLGIQR